MADERGSSNQSEKKTHLRLVQPGLRPILPPVKAPALPPTALSGRILKDSPTVSAYAPPSMQGAPRARLGDVGAQMHSLIVGDLRRDFAQVIELQSRLRFYLQELEELVK